MTAATQPELDLGAWLLLQADADEAVALAAGGEMWFAAEVPGRTKRKRLDDPHEIIIDSPSSLITYACAKPEHGAHIEAWDPERVLGVVRLVREMVALHVNAAEWSEEPDCPDPATYRLVAGAHLDTLRALAVTLYGERDGAGRWADE